MSLQNIKMFLWRTGCYLWMSVENARPWQKIKQWIKIQPIYLKRKRMRKKISTKSFACWREIFPSTTRSEELPKHRETPTQTERIGIYVIFLWFSTAIQLKNSKNILRWLWTKLWSTCKYTSHSELSTQKQNDRISWIWKLEFN